MNILHLQRNMQGLRQRYAINQSIHGLFKTGFKLENIIQHVSE